MKVLIAGATGAIGRPLILALIRAGHDVVGMTSSERGLPTLEVRGAGGVVANALDAQAVETAIKRVRPDAVIDELTSLPKHYTPEEMRAAADRDRTVRPRRTECSRCRESCRGAALCCAIHRILLCTGSGLAAEADPLALNASPAVSASARTYAQVEERVLGVRICKASHCAMASFTARVPGSPKAVM